jgi:hypothetical protein
MGFDAVTIVRAAKSNTKIRRRENVNFILESRVVRWMTILKFGCVVELGGCFVRDHLIQPTVALPTKGVNCTLMQVQLMKHSCTQK